MMSPAEILAGLVPAAFRLATQALGAILKGDVARAKRKAAEAARRQGVRLAADAELRARSGKRK